MLPGLCVVEPTGVRRGASARLEAMVREAFTLQGWSAFDMPREDAAYHEAGHAVVFAAEGKTVEQVSIRRENIKGRSNWVGYTKAVAPFAITLTSNPSDDLQRVRFILAGRLAETILHSGNDRQGSSLDELELAEGICVTAGRKLGRDAFSLMAEQRTSVRNTLQCFWPSLRKLAIALDRDRRITGPRLAAYLAPVVEARS